jgi:hypothetical protein
MKRFGSFLLLCTLCLTLTNCGESPNSDASNQAIKELPNGEKHSIVAYIRQDPNLPVEAQIALYHKLKKTQPEAFDFENEDALNMYGYTLLRQNRIKEAIQIFQLVVDEFHSANSYDSLGEAYLKDGNTKLALVHYKKALELNPDNFKAEDVIESIEHPEKDNQQKINSFNTRYSKAQYVADLDQLGKRILEVHPNALKFISKAAFLEGIEAKKALINENTTYPEFMWHCNAIVASINCSHSYVSYFQEEMRMLPDSLYFPLGVRLINEHLYVVDPYNNGNQVQVKDEITAINGVPTAELMENMYAHIPSQGYVKSSKAHYFNARASAMIPYALHWPAIYTLTLKGKTHAVSLKPYRPIKDIRSSPSLTNCDEYLCLELLPNHTALLTIASFNYYQGGELPVFTNFIDKSMATLRKEKVQHLIIDVRQNGGGAPEAGIHLLRYLQPKPFTYFANVDYPGKTGKATGETEVAPFENPYRGKLYFLIDGKGNSTTGHFMSLVKSWKLGPIVGEELGANQFCSGGQTIGRLRNTKLYYHLGNNTHQTTAVHLPPEQGILPDHFVAQTIDDYLEGKDVVKLFALKLTRENQL